MRSGRPSGWPSLPYHLMNSASLASGTFWAEMFFSFTRSVLPGLPQSTSSSFCAEPGMTVTVVPLLLPKHPVAAAISPAAHRRICRRFITSPHGCSFKANPGRQAGGGATLGLTAGVRQEDAPDDMPPLYPWRGPNRNGKSRPVSLSYAIGKDSPPTPRHAPPPPLPLPPFPSSRPSPP